MNIEDYIQRFQDGGSPGRGPDLTEDDPLFIREDLPETPDAKAARRAGLFAPKELEKEPELDYAYGMPEGSILSRMIMPMRREVISPEKSYPTPDAPFAGFDSDGRSMISITTDPAVYGPPDWGASYMPVVQGAMTAYDVLMETVKHPIDAATGLAEGLSQYLDDQMQTANAGAPLWDPETGQMKEFDPFMVPTMLAPGSVATRIAASSTPNSITFGIMGGGKSTSGSSRFDNPRVKALEADVNARIYNTKDRDQYLKEFSENPKDPRFQAAQEVFDDTRVFVGSDGDLRFEIDTRAAKLNVNKIQDDVIYGAADTGLPRSLSEFLEFDELFKEYPQLADYKVVLLPRNRRTIMQDGVEKELSGQFDPKTKKIFVNPTLGYINKGMGKDGNRLFDPEEVNSALLHEIQHAVQDIEGFQPGGGARLPPAVYNTLVGEVESRNVQGRRERPELRELIPDATSDFPPSQQRMFDGDGGVVNSVSDGDSLEEIMERLKEKVVNTPNVPRETPTRAPLPEAQVVDPYEYPADTRYRQNNPRR